MEEEFIIDSINDVIYDAERSYTRTNHTELVSFELLSLCLGSILIPSLIYDVMSRDMLSGFVWLRDGNIVFHYLCLISVYLFNFQHFIVHHLKQKIMKLNV